MSNNILRSSSGGTDSATRARAMGEKEPTVDQEIIDAADPVEAYHRSRLYSLLSLLLDRPGDDHEEIVENGVFAEHLQESARIYGDEKLARAAERVLEAFTDFDEHRHEWASLFGVEEGVTVSPYQLTYLPGPLMTTVRELADMKGFYQAFDLQIADSERDRGDNIIFQTEFLGHLSLREAVLRDEGETDGVEVVVEARRRFLEEHLGRWYWRFAEEVTKQDDGFYAAIVELLAILVESEIETLDLDPKWVPDDPAVTEWNEGVFGESGRSCGGCGSDPSGQHTDAIGEEEVDMEFGEYGPLGEGDRN